MIFNVAPAQSVNKPLFVNKVILLHLYADSMCCLQLVQFQLPKKSINIDFTNRTDL